MCQGKIDEENLENRSELIHSFRIGKIIRGHYTQVSCDRYLAEHLSMVYWMERTL